MEFGNENLNAINLKIQDFMFKKSDKIEIVEYLKTKVIL